MAQRLEFKEPIPYLSIVMIVIILIDAYSFNTKQHQWASYHYYLDQLQPHHRPGTGPLQARYRPGTGPVQARYRPGTGPVQARYRPTTGYSLLTLLWRSEDLCIPTTSCATQVSIDTMMERSNFNSSLA